MGIMKDENEPSPLHACMKLRMKISFEKCFFPECQLCWPVLRRNTGTHWPASRAIKILASVFTVLGCKMSSI